MKVNDLIKKLEKLPAESRVVVAGYEDGLADVINAKEISIKLEANKEWYYGRHEETAPCEPGAIMAVIIVAEQERKIMGKAKFKQIEIGKIPEDWEIGHISDLIKVVPGFAIERKDMSDSGDIPVIKIKNITNQRTVNISDTQYISNELFQNLKEQYKLKAGNIVVAMTGATIGKAGKIPFTEYKFALNQRVAKLISKRMDDLEYVYQIFHSDLIQNNILNYATGAAQQNISSSLIGKIIIPIPLENERKKIAKILSDLDSKIEINQQMNKTLEAIGHALFKRWFVDFEFPNEEGQPYKSTGGEMVDSELGEIPKGWRAGTLKEIIEITSGKRPSDKSDIKKDEFNIPLIGASSIMGYVRESLYNEPILIIGRVGTHGVVQRVSYPSFPSDNTLVIKSRYYNFVFHSLKRLDYNSLNVGTTQPLITQSGIKQTEIIIPQNDILIKFEKTLMALYKSIDRNLNENENLSQIRDSLLPPLMSGKIRVN